MDAELRCRAPGDALHREQSRSAGLVESIGNFRWSSAYRRADAGAKAVASVELKLPLQAKARSTIWSPLHRCESLLHRLSLAHYFFSSGADWASKFMMPSAKSQFRILHLRGRCRTSEFERCPSGRQTARSVRRAVRRSEVRERQKLILLQIAKRKVGLVVIDKGPHQDVRFRVTRAPTPVIPEGRTAACNWIRVLNGKVDNACSSWKSSPPPTALPRYCFKSIGCLRRCCRFRLRRLR